jgi:uncharacterized protein YdbL (DUF1318 family)
LCNGFFTATIQFSDVFWHFAKTAAIDLKSIQAFHSHMKPFAIFTICLAILFSENLFAQTNATDVAAEKEKVTLEKHLAPVLKALQLGDAAKETKVREILTAQFAALKTWHAANDAQIKSLWDDFNQARKALNVTNANAALDKIDGVYATFKPQHEKFLSDLGAVLSPAQVETVKDALTIGKVKFTYHVYLQIFPTLTDAQKAVVLQDLKMAREQAIDCEAMTEKSAFFKKYKIIIEDNYLTAQGYDPKQARKDFAAKQKAEKKTGDTEK